MQEDPFFQGYVKNRSLPIIELISPADCTVYRLNRYVTGYYTLLGFGLSKFVGKPEFKDCSESQVLIWGMYGKENVRFIKL